MLPEKGHFVITFLREGLEMIGKTISHYRILATKVVPFGKKLGEGGHRYSL
jgi:hypothetical protein